MFAVPENTVAPAEDSWQSHPVRLAMRIAAEPLRWRHLLRYDPNHRNAVLISHDHARQAWLLTWLPGQRAPMHDHGETAGAFTLVHGALSESVVRNRASHETLRSPHMLRAGQSRVFGPGYVHALANEGHIPAVSVHVYPVLARGPRPYGQDPCEGLPHW